MIRVGSIVLRVDDLQRQAEFWEAALDYVRRATESDDFVLLRPRDGVGPNLSLDQVHSTVQVPPSAPTTGRGAHWPGSGEAGSTGQVGPASACPPIW
jgi:hypothetical protein